ncbi:MAG: tryptophan-rich sensory protein [Clostridia bacterium]|nr:tryptophan-rich sensory protein [Clostridia bacterium]
MEETKPWKKWVSLAGWIVGTVAVGAIGGLIGGTDRYESLIQPPLAPPGWLFPVVWTILYILMAIGVWLVLQTREPGTYEAVQRYILQLLVNVLWPLIFFRLEWRLFAFFWLLLLLVLVSLTFASFRKFSKPAAYLLIPYLLWLLFAGYLNLSIYVLNG